VVWQPGHPSLSHMCMFPACGVNRCISLPFGPSFSRRPRNRVNGLHFVIPLLCSSHGIPSFLIHREREQESRYLEFACTAVTSSGHRSSLRRKQLRRHVPKPLTTMSGSSARAPLLRSDCPYLDTCPPLGLAPILRFCIGEPRRLQQCTQRPRHLIGTTPPIDDAWTGGIGYALRGMLRTPFAPGGH
jgi:hypothetical protein